MVRIVPGGTWKLNPACVADLRRCTPQKARASNLGSVLDVLEVEVDGVNVSEGLGEAALFATVDELVSVAVRLCRDPTAGGQVPLCGAELVLGRRGTQVSLSLVSLARPARLLAGELEVELADFARAVASCADRLLADLREVNPALLASSVARGLAPRMRTLRKAAALASAPERARPRRRSAPCGPGPSPAAGALCLAVTLGDDSGRIEGYRRGADLYSLLFPGQLSLRCADGEELGLAVGPPFLTLTELVRSAAAVLAAVDAGEPRWRGPLAPGAPLLDLDLRASILVAEGRAVRCTPLDLARAFLEGAVDFGGAVVARNPAQAKNPYLAGLVEEARDRLTHLRQVAAGDLIARAVPAGAEAAARAPPRLGTGRLKRLGFRTAWSGVDVGSPASRLALSPTALVTFLRRHVAFLDRSCGESLARRPCEAAFRAPHGVLLESSGRIEWLDDAGQPRAVRWPTPMAPVRLTGVCATPAHGPGGAPAAACVFDGRVLAALLWPTGRMAWAVDAPQALNLTCAASARLVFAASDDGRFWGVDAQTGTLAFRTATGVERPGPLAVSSRFVASVGMKGSTPALAAADCRTGRPRFTRVLPMEAAGLPLLLAGLGTAVGGVSDGASLVCAFSAEGKPRFSTSLGRAGVPALARGRDRIFAGLRDGSVSCLAPDGTVVWASRPGEVELERAMPPRLMRGVLVTAGDPVRALDPSTGAVLCTLPRTRGLSAFEVSEDLDVFVVDDDGVAASFQLATHLSVVE